MDKNVKNKLLITITIFTTIGLLLLVFRLPIGFFIGDITSKTSFVPTPFEKETIIGTWNGDMPEREIKKASENPEYMAGGTYFLTLNENDTFTLTDEKAGTILDEGTFEVIDDSETDDRLGKTLTFKNASGEQLYYGFLIDAIDIDMYTMYLTLMGEEKAFYIGTNYYGETDRAEFNEVELEKSENHTEDVPQEIK